MENTKAISTTVLAALLERHGGVTSNLNAECVVYLTAEWLQPVDTLVLAYMEQNLRGKTLVVVQRDEYDIGHPQSSAARSPSTILRCDQNEFRDVCRGLGITRLPATFVFNPTTREQQTRTTNSDSGYAIDALVHSMQRTPNVSEWLPLQTTACGSLDAEDPSLTTLRDHARQLFEQGDFIAAAKEFTRVLLQCPTCAKSNFNMAVILQMLDENYFAVDHMLRVVAVDDHDAVAHTVLRTVLYPAEPELVIHGYEQIVAHHSDHVRDAHSLATLRGQATSASADYVRQVFDHLADTFEEKLVTHLEYRVPWQIVDALQTCNAFPSTTAPFRAVDLGCGTGLCGRLLRPFASHIAGIDLSPLMIEKTRETGFYDELATADIIPYLCSKPHTSIDLVVSADVWIYVGALDEIFPVVAQKLSPNGYFAFSTELLADADADAAGGSVSFQLATSGRFKHSESYIASLAATNGFTILVEDTIVVRKESGEPIPGRVYVLHKTA